MLRFLKRWWNRRYPGWVAEVALRYLPIVDLLRQDPPRGAILEVGVNSLGLTAYVPIPVVGVDIQFSVQRSPLVTAVCARGQALPFKGQSFEDTVCMDTLEHIPVPERDRFVNELLRVTQRRVYLGCPMGKTAELEDLALNEAYRRKRGQTFEFLDQHIEYGLPTIGRLSEQVRVHAGHQGRSVRLQTWPNQNLRLHRILLALWFETGRVSYLLHRLAVLLVHVRGWLNFGSCYRQIMVIDLGCDGGSSPNSSSRA